MDHSETPRARLFSIAAMLAPYIAVILIATVVEHAAHRAAWGVRGEPAASVATYTVQQSLTPWQTLLKHNVVYWGMWALFTPLIAGAAQLRWKRFAWWIVPGWVLFGVATSSLHSVTAELLTTGLDAAVAGKTSLFVSSFRLISVASRVETALVTFGLITGTVFALRYYRDAQSRRMKEARLAAQLARSELHVLRMQLHPHFFFNTLHTASALMEDDVPGARRVLAALGDLLRSSIDHGADQEVTLRTELSFVSRYLDIQRARFGDRITFDVDVPDSLQDMLVPNLLLQPLIENAIRHGIEPTGSNGRIELRARPNANALHIEIVNPVPVAAQPRLQQENSGFGLKNIAARMTQMYGDRQSLAHGQDNGVYRVSIILPLRDATPAHPALC